MTNCDIVILTALELEYRAVRERLTGLNEYLHPYGTRFEIGDAPGGCRIALGNVGRGNAGSAVLSERAINEFDPTALLFVGVAGALRSHVNPGDLVVATRVCAYHGGKSEDDGTKSRPETWEVSHRVTQIAHHINLTNEWEGGVTPDGAVVHFGPIAAGEAVLNSRTSEQARWISQNYNDCIAVEMESAGVAKAAHLCDALAMGVVRGISDRGDGSKSETTDRRRQPLAAGRAAAFAVALAAALAKGRPARAGNQQDPIRSGGMVMKNTNVARGHALVGVQMGQVLGNVQITSVPETSMSLADELAAFGQNLRRAHAAGEIDRDAFESAQAELAVVDQSLAANDSTGPRRVVLALKKIRGLVGDVTNLTQQVTTLISLGKGVS